MNRAFDDAFKARFRSIKVYAGDAHQIETTLNKLSDEGYEVLNILPLQDVSSNVHHNGDGKQYFGGMYTTNSLQIIAKKYELKADVT